MPPLLFTGVWLHDTLDPGPTRPPGCRQRGIWGLKAGYGLSLPLPKDHPAQTQGQRWPLDFPEHPAYTQK